MAETTSTWLWFLQVFGLNLWSTVYKYIIFSLAIQALFKNGEDSPCAWVPIPYLTDYCKIFFTRDYFFLTEGTVMTMIVLAAIIEWLNNFYFFNLVYKYIISKVLQQDGTFFEELRRMLYSSSAFKEGGLVSCNPAELWPATQVLSDVGFLHAKLNDAQEHVLEVNTKGRGVFRFVIGQLDINIKTNQLTANSEIWHVESITNIEDSETEVLLREMTIQQVNLLIKVLRKWETETPHVGVIQSASKLLGFNVLHAMQLSEILDHIKEGNDIMMADTSLKGERVFIAGQMGSVKFKQKKHEEV
jgi:hypothetical protein